MKHLQLFLLMLLPTIGFAQVSIDNTKPVKVIDSTVTKTVNGNVTTTTTKVVTKDPSQKIDNTIITVETTTQVKPKLADGSTTGEEEFTTRTQTQEIDSGKVVPEIVDSRDDYKKAKIEILKSEVEDFHYKITYFDLGDKAGNKPKLKIFKSKIEADDYVSNVQYGFGLFRPQLFAVPFKIRPKTEDRPQIAKADIDNLGVFFPLAQIKSERLFPDGGTSTHRWSAGVHICPMVETYDTENTEPDIEDEVTNLGVSLGLAITYTYNDITFAVIPAGFDYGFTSEASDWIYQGQHWYGFGIGLDLDILDVLKGD